MRRFPISVLVILIYLVACTPSPPSIQATATVESIPTSVEYNFELIPIVDHPTIRAEALAYELRLLQTLGEEKEFEYPFNSAVYQEIERQWLAIHQKMDQIREAPLSISIPESDLSLISRLDAYQLWLTNVFMTANAVNPLLPLQDTEVNVTEEGPTEVFGGVVNTRSVLTRSTDNGQFSDKIEITAKFEGESDEAIVTQEIKKNTEAKIDRCPDEQGRLVGSYIINEKEQKTARIPDKISASKQVGFTIKTDFIVDVNDVAEVAQVNLTITGEGAIIVQGTRVGDSAEGVYHRWVAEGENTNAGYDPENGTLVNRKVSGNYKTSDPAMSNAVDELISFYIVDGSGSVANLIKRARDHWRNGGCVEIVVGNNPDGKVMRPGEKVQFTGELVHMEQHNKIDGPIEAKAGNGGIVPEKALVRPPIDFSYTAPTSGSGLLYAARYGDTVQLNSTSKYGIANTFMITMSLDLGVWQGSGQATFVQDRLPLELRTSVGEVSFQFEARDPMDISGTGTLILSEDKIEMIFDKGSPTGVCTRPDIASHPIPVTISGAITNEGQFELWVSPDVVEVPAEWICKKDVLQIFGGQTSPEPFSFKIDVRDGATTDGNYVRKSAGLMGISSTSTVQYSVSIAILK